MDLIMNKKDVNKKFKIKSKENRFENMIIFKYK